MLILTRKAGERILLNPNALEPITATVVAVNNGRAQLHIDAPEGIDLHINHASDIAMLDPGTHAEIVIRIVAVNSRNAIVGIDAPRSVLVLREEVHKRMQRQDAVA